MIYDNYLYNKQIKLTFEEIKHSYFYEGKKVPSVTNAIGILAKPALINWAAGMATDYWKENIKPGVAYDEIQINTIWKEARSAHYKKKVETGDIGTFIHQWVSDYIKGKNPPPPTNDQLKKSTEQFKNWQKDYKVKFLASEQVVYSRKNNYCGTLDFICEIGGKLYLGDLKTSSGIYYNEYGMQVTAYQMAREEEFPKEKYIGGAIIRIGRDGAFEVWKFEDNTIFREGFLAALKLYETNEKIQQGVKSGEIGSKGSNTVE